MVSGRCKGSVKKKRGRSEPSGGRARLWPCNRRESSMQNRVMLMEDDDEQRELLARYLTNQGFTVREAANGRDGLALALGQDCDIVVLDIMLPDINGLDVLRELRGQTHLPVILLTARGDETDRIVGFEVGADDSSRNPATPGSWLPACRRCFAASPGIRNPMWTPPAPTGTCGLSPANGEYIRMMRPWN